MKRFFSLLIIFQTASLSAQSIESSPLIFSYEGIRFEMAMSWEQALTKAKTENKIIFLDCYATWCIPCKQMDQSVYPLEKVGKYFNEHFISLKVQMDTSENDGEPVKSWYADAHYIQQQYKVDAFPTYLFFTPDGKLLNRGLGAKSANDFLNLAATTIDPKNQYYVLLDQYKHGKRDPAQMGYLARKTLLLGDTAQAGEIAKEYMLHLKKQDLFTKENIQFMSEFTKSSNDRGFKFFYQYADSINRVMNNDTYAQQIVQLIIYQEMLQSSFEKANKLNETPSWDQAKLAIQKKYSLDYAARVVTAARMTWAYQHKNWADYTRYTVQYVEKFISKTNSAPLFLLSLNNYAWDVFLYSQDRKELEAALSWSGRALLGRPSANWMDTYANILYKLSRQKEAIFWDGIAATLAPDDQSIQSNLEKMKKGEPTWSNN